MMWIGGFLKKKTLKSVIPHRVQWFWVWSKFVLGGYLYKSLQYPTDYRRRYSQWLSRGMPVLWLTGIWFFFFGPLGVWTMHTETREGLNETREGLNDSPTYANFLILQGIIFFLWQMFYFIIFGMIQLIMFFPVSKYLFSKEGRG